MKMKKKYCIAAVLIALFCIAYDAKDTKICASNIYDFEINSSGVLTKYKGIGGNVVIPSNVKEIGKKAFAGNGSITSVTFSDNVTIIGNSAFDSCTNLEKVTLPSKLKTIQDNAFWGCTSLKSVNIPSSVTSIGSGAFCQCDVLTGLYIPSTVTTINNYSVGFLYVNAEYTPTIDFVIMGEHNTAAEAYAQKYQIPFLTKSDLTATISDVKSSKKGKATVKWVRNTNATKYQIRYSTDKKFKSAKTINASKEISSKTISSLKKGKTYYFQIRGCRTIAENDYYSIWSSTKTIKIKK